MRAVLMIVLVVIAIQILQQVLTVVLWGIGIYVVVQALGATGRPSNRPR